MTPTAQMSAACSWILERILQAFFATQVGAFVYFMAVVLVEMEKLFRLGAICFRSRWLSGGAALGSGLLLGVERLELVHGCCVLRMIRSQAAHLAQNADSGGANVFERLTYVVGADAGAVCEITSAAAVLSRKNDVGVD